MATTLFTPTECKHLAISKARCFARELRSKTNRLFEVKIEGFGNHVVSVYDTETKAFVMGFEGSTWEQVFLSVRDAWNAYIAVRNY